MSLFEPKRVVISGLGSITPIGNNPKDYWQGLMQGKNGIVPITHFDCAKHACRIAGQVKEFDPINLFG